MNKRKPLALGWLRRLVGAKASLIIGASVFGLIVLMCIFVPILSPYAPDALVARALQAPSLAHPFGTDGVGRDVFVRTFAGGRIDLVAAAVVAASVFIIGTTLGTLAGATRLGWLEGTLMRFVDAVIAFPTVILLLALVVVFGKVEAGGLAPAGLLAAMAGLMLVMWSSYARMAHGQALAMRNSDFILATRVSGLSPLRVVMRHIVPGVARVNLALAVGDLVLVAVILSSLPFLGVGVQPPAAEWGSIMYEGRGFLRQAWWITLFPGAVLALTGLSLSFMADSLLDSRKKATA
ncbi:ABC transporter permease [Pseudarthrobacter sulfonivorans]|uniref:ABC transporter permease n=1 Tax=Pseudarthrobacter sulfonivorans TaxID=121292 RepID=UPI002105D96B|nr:ABC transporter permease [Pseudarthrobacter sulfonivorans]